jgi:hypothetical protein
LDEVGGAIEEVSAISSMVRPRFDEVGRTMEDARAASEWTAARFDEVPWNQTAGEGEALGAAAALSRTGDSSTIM